MPRAPRRAMGKVGRGSPARSSPVRGGTMGAPGRRPTMGALRLRKKQADLDKSRRESRQRGRFALNDRLHEQTPRDTNGVPIRRKESAAHPLDVAKAELRRKSFDRLGVHEDAPARDEDYQVAGLSKTVMKGIRRTDEELAVLHDELDLAKIKKVADRLHKFAVSKYANLRDMYTKFDDDNDGVLTKDEWCDKLPKMGFPIAREDAGLIYDIVDLNKDGHMSYSEFWQIFNPDKSVFTVDNLPLHVVSAKENLTGDYVDKVLPRQVLFDSKKEMAAARKDPAAAAAAAGYSMESETTTDVDRAKAAQLKNAVRDKLLNLGSSMGGSHKPHQEHTAFLAAFRTYDTDQVGFITYDHFRDAVGPRGLNLGLSREDTNALILLCDEDKNGAISYQEFLHCLSAVDRNLGEGVIIEGRERSLARQQARVKMTFPEFDDPADPADSACPSFRSTARPDEEGDYKADLEELIEDHRTTPAPEQVRGERDDEGEGKRGGGAEEKSRGAATTMTEDNLTPRGGTRRQQQLEPLPQRPSTSPATSTGSRSARGGGSAGRRSPGSPGSGGGGGGGGGGDASRGGQEAEMRRPMTVDSGSAIQEGLLTPHSEDGDTFVGRRGKPINQGLGPTMDLIGTGVLNNAAEKKTHFAHLNRETRFPYPQPVHLPGGGFGVKLSHQQLRGTDPGALFRRASRTHRLPLSRTDRPQTAEPFTLTHHRRLERVTARSPISVVKERIRQRSQEGDEEVHEGGSSAGGQEDIDPEELRPHSAAPGQFMRTRYFGAIPSPDPNPRYNPGLHGKVYQYPGFGHTRRHISPQVAQPQQSAFFSTERRRFRPQTTHPPVPKVTIEGTLEDRRHDARRRLRGKNRNKGRQRVINAYTRQEFVDTKRDFERCRTKAQQTLTFMAKQIADEVQPLPPGTKGRGTGFWVDHKYSPFNITQTTRWYASSTM